MNVFADTMVLTGRMMKHMTRDHANAGIHLYFRRGDDDPARDL